MSVASADKWSPGVPIFAMKEWPNRLKMEIVPNMWNNCNLSQLKPCNRNQYVCIVSRELLGLFPEEIHGAIHFYSILRLYPVIITCACQAAPPLTATLEASQKVRDSCNMLAVTLCDTWLSMASNPCLYVQQTTSGDHLSVAAGEAFKIRKCEGELAVCEVST